MRHRLPVLLLTLLAACSDSSGGGADDTAADTNSDAYDAPDGSGTDDTGADSGDADDALDVPADDSAEPDGSGDSDASDDTGATPAFSRTYTDAAEMPAPDGYRWARSIVHLHSTHSHDACDDVPRLEDGSYNLPCLASLRRALCDVGIDVAYVTDHPTHMDEVVFVDALLHEPSLDELVYDELERPFANWITCEDGQRVLVRAGSESSGFMPVGLHEHVDPDQPTRHEILGAYTADAATRMREAGALVWVAHTEGRSADELRPLGVDGLEIYQLHGNLDPRIRSELLGLDALGPITDLFPLIAGTSDVPPDLALLGFLEENVPSLNTWATLLAEGPMVGTAGTDAHENTFPGEATDGERLDSYRRMMSWFSNYLLVDGELTPESADDALGAGRVLIAFDLLGDPSGFDAAVFTGPEGATRVEMGGTTEIDGSAVLRGSVPTPTGPSGIEAPVTTLLLQADGAGWRQVASQGAGAFAFVLEDAGVYRLEVRVTGEHLAPWTGGFDWAEREYPWIYTNAWRIGVGDE